MQAITEAIVFYWWKFLPIGGLLWLLMQLYFKVADRYNIIDKPNQRSSHSSITIRGGGILFPLAWLLWMLFFNKWGTWTPITLAVGLVSFISFIDDIKPQRAAVRFGIHLLAFSLLIYNLGIFAAWPWWSVVLVYIVGIGTLNAINFMDGINGITGLYMLSLIASLFWVIPEFNHLLFTFMMAIGVFGFYNFRKKAKCFAGDVGSVSIGFMIIFLLLFAIKYKGQTNAPDFRYLFFLSIYGVDSVLTIIHRLILKENIFDAHRKHLYQYLSNEAKIPHLRVAALYALMQLALNFYLISNAFSWLGLILILLILALVYVFIKRSIIKQTGLRS